MTTHSTDSPGPPALLIDRVVTAPGAGAEFLHRYRHEYLPAAAERGIRARSVLVSPPLWLEHDGNEVTVVLEVDGAAGWWRAALAARHDPAPARWWDSVAPLVVSRSRSSAAAAEDLGELADV